MKPLALLLSCSCLLLAADPVTPRRLHLTEAIRLSASVAPVGLARLDVAIARAGLGGQRMALLPQLAAEGGLSRLTVAPQPVEANPIAIGPGDIWDARLRLGQALLDLDAWYRTDAAGRRLAAAEATAALALEEAAAQAGLAYVTLASSEALLLVRRQDLALAEELAAQAKARVEAGATEAIAATRAATRVESARSNVVAAEGLVRRASIILARAMHEDPTSVFTAADALGDALASTAAPTDAEAAETLAARTRAELQVSVETLAALDAETRASRGARWPKLSVFADGGRTGPELDDTVTTWQVGLQLSIPLVDRKPYDERAAILRLEREHLSARDLGERIRAEVREALVTLATAQARLVADLDVRRLAEQELSEARARFAAGAAGNLEIIDAQFTRTRAMEAVLTAQDVAARARVNLARAVGVATGLK